MTEPKKPVQLIAPKTPAYFPQGQIEGYMVLPFFGQDVTVIGGSFDAFAEKTYSIGVCLEDKSAKAEHASISFPIKDFTAPSVADTQDLLEAVVSRAFEQPGLPIYVGCRAGMGRTGTILAALAKVSDLNPQNPVAFVRAAYNPGAVETQAQAKLVEQIDRNRVREVLEAEFNHYRGPVLKRAPTAAPTAAQAFAKLTLVQKIKSIFFG